MNTVRPATTRGTGVLLALMAYGLWGLFPLYFKQLAGVDPLEVIAWRILCSALTLGFCLLLMPGPSRVWLRIRAIRQWGLVVAATLLISINWFVFIYAIAHDQILQSSLGYFLVPIINSALGVLMFAERPNRLKQMALGVAAVGMSVTFFVAGVVPILSLILAVTFGLYGAVRKRSDVDSATGLFLETLMLLPLAAGFLLFFGTPASQLPGAETRYWLFASGVVTLVPLLGMVGAARRIELGTLGFIQYLTPVMQFGIAVRVYGEALDQARVMAFATTLLAVGLWVAGCYFSRRAQAMAVP